jgi:regulator of sirC expression with transglutaminase-like and TPR domain
MSDEEIEKLAELIYQKLVKKEQDYIDSLELPIDWVADDTSGAWYKFEPPSYTSGKDLLMQRLVALNIEKQELVEQEQYEELIKLQERIDEIKEQLKKYKD